jgi:two-component system sensor histidine kinase KdpD
MTRLQAGGVVLRAQWLPLEEVVGSALLRLERRLGDRPVEVALAADSPLLWVDPVLLEQALVNLADNALKYSPEPSPIEVRSFVRGGVIAIAVLDRGPGLPVGLGQRVFEKFVRGDARDRDGFGLGLAICRAIVELHGGAIAARPREGGGACLEITLPLRVDQPAAAIDAPAVRESAWPPVASSCCSSRTRRRCGGSCGRPSRRRASASSKRRPSARRWWRSRPTTPISCCSTSGCRTATGSP